MDTWQPLIEHTLYRILCDTRCGPEFPDLICVDSVGVTCLWFLVSGSAMEEDVLTWELRSCSVEWAPPVLAIMFQTVPLIMPKQIEYVCVREINNCQRPCNNDIVMVKHHCFTMNCCHFHEFVWFTSRPAFRGFHDSGN